jgi:hypothetical protein
MASVSRWKKIVAWHGTGVTLSRLVELVFDYELAVCSTFLTPGNVKKQESDDLSTA